MGDVHLSDGVPPCSGGEVCVPLRHRDMLAGAYAPVSNTQARQLKGQEPGKGWSTDPIGWGLGIGIVALPL
jgi:hypothetical protein